MASTQCIRLDPSRVYRAWVGNNPKAFSVPTTYLLRVGDIFHTCQCPSNDVVLEYINGREITLSYTYKQRKVFMNLYYRVQ